MDKILQQFLEVATLQNVSHAAKKLCLSQPTLTHNMKKLEEWRCSLYVLVTVFTPPNNHDFASSLCGSRTRKHAK